MKQKIKLKAELADNFGLYPSPRRPPRDDSAPLHFELFSLEQLKLHAEAIARRHEVVPGLGTDQLLPRLAANEVVLKQVYERLCAAVLQKQRISPAGEWLLDNFHIIEEQILTARRHLPKGYSRELPHLKNADSVGLPRVYDLALEVIAHVDGRVDQENIMTFVAAYQRVTRLKLGEFWAIPIMLRLALIENLRRVAVRVAIGMDDRDEAAEWTKKMVHATESDPKNLIIVVADMARSNPPMSNAFVAELVRTLQGQAPVLDIPLTWLEQQMGSLGTSIKQKVHLESQQQAANQVSVGASIGSLRFLGAIDWREFVESMNPVEKHLRQDPAGIYSQMDFATRDRYRHVIERLAKRSGRDEWDIARMAVSLAGQAQPSLDGTGDLRHSHVGYFLIGKGLAEVEKLLPIPQWSSRLKAPFSVKARFCLYVWSIALFAVAATSFVIVGFLPPDTSSLLVIFMYVLTITCISQVAVTLVNWLATLTTKPSILPRMDFTKGLPLENKTLIAIPCMLISDKNIDTLIDALEVRFLANQDQALRFALLSDFADAPQATMPNDNHLLARARAGIDALNERYGTFDRGGERTSAPFLLLHRPRLWNPGEGVWMGYERKRGKLEALNHLLIKGIEEEGRLKDFSVAIGDISFLAGIKQVITLDSDTQLPRDAARLLVATIAHPLNRPRFDPVARRVVEGYGILQPRVGISLPGARKSWYVRLYGGDPGTDLYTRAVSDVYQDLFGEGSFVGKGIYDVAAFSASLSNKVPENLILSHDLLEGSYARCGLVSDVVLYEEHPTHYGEDAKRRRRWTRGDWQIIFWLLPFVPTLSGKWQKNPLSVLAKWKIFDNLRRSLVPVGTTLLLTLMWLVLPHVGVLTCVILALYFLPSLLTFLAEVARKSPEERLHLHLSASLATLVHRVIQGLLGLVFLPYDAAISLEAIGRSSFRMFVSRKHLLEWQPAGDPRQKTSIQFFSFLKTMLSPPLWTLFIVGLLYYIHPQGLIPASPLLFYWFVSPLFAFLLSRPLPQTDAPLETEETTYLHRLARKTWRFFEVFGGAQDNWLPPDNYQEFPVGVVAHRTSPTNIGLSLLSNLAAYDFGYLSFVQLLERTKRTFDSMARLERFRGHFYNWYDTKTLKPLLPQYVSTVDSGNLSGLLLTLKPGLLELPSHQIVSKDVFQGLADTIASLGEKDKLPAKHRTDLGLLLSDLRSTLPTPQEARLVSGRIEALIAAMRQDLGVESWIDKDASWWLDALEKQKEEALEKPLRTFAPWFTLPDHLAAQDWDHAIFDLHMIPTLQQVSALEEHVVPQIDALLANLKHEREWLLQLRQCMIGASHSANKVIRQAGELAKQCEGFATVEYDFLYDKTRHLLTIGYNVSEHRRDSSFYDLLASEARLCSFVGIAQGALPQEHWFALGRLLTAWKGEPTLLSWSGSMFEYLMPLLVMPTFKNTLLDQTYRTAIQRQIEYGRQRGVPWGLSESGYNTTDVNLNYQYRAFGVPGLGFKRGLADDLVIAPYATVMALMVMPHKACENMRRMSGLGYEGAYGFYEAVDFTTTRLPAEEKQVVIKSFMAHHQGMSFLAFAYHLNGRRMQKRFESDPHFKATELLLHERMPKATIFHPHAPEVSDAAGRAGERESVMRVIATHDTARPEVHLLSNGRYSVMVTNSGGGYSRWKNLALTRWREDPTADEWGTFCYVRDVESREVWSASHHPTQRTASHYEAIFPQAKAEFRRRDHDIEMHTEITVSPEDDIELRRYSLTNLSSKKRVIELTTYAEVILASQAADEAHPAFSNLFVQTAIMPSKHAIFCTRRPRAAQEKTPTMMHLLCVHGETSGHVSYETNRSKFIGRGNTLANPAAMDLEALSGSEGSVLDPIVAIRCRVEIEPEATVRIHIVTGVGESEGEAAVLAEKYYDRHIADRVFELAWTHNQVVLRQLNLSEADAELFSKLASSVLYANAARRANPSVLLTNRRGQSGLWGYGISGDLPIVLLRVGTQDNTDVVRQVIQAHGYWRSMGLAVDLVIWNEDDSGYRQNLHDLLLTLIAAGNGSGLLDKSGGIFVRRAEQMSEEDQVLLQTVARIIITDGGGTLSEQLERRGRGRKYPPLLVPSREALSMAENKVPDSLESDVLGRANGDQPDPLQFENGLGGFSQDGTEYRITTFGDKRTPAPWVNVLANPYFGSIVSESGSSYTWCENAHEFRLTPWYNDALSDKGGEAFYVRDEESGDFWSPTPLPARPKSSCMTSHGFGYSTFDLEHAGIASTLTTFVAIDAPVKMTMLRVRNTGPSSRHLSVTGYCEWTLGELRRNSLLHVTTEIDPTNAALCARNPYHAEFGSRIAFFDVSSKDRTVTGDRSEFLGRNGRLESPAAMRRSNLSGRVGAGLDACAAMQTAFELAPGEERELSFVLGVGRDVDDVRTLIRRFGAVSSARNALQLVKAHWTDTLGAVQVKTPDPSLDVLVNGWLTYQILACRVWARSGYYQSGGAFGFRDQLQDVMAMLHTRPRLLREHILRCAAHQFREGDVQHWWHPPSNRGVRTHFSDDYLWLPLATSRYVLGVGDLGVLDVRVEFIEGRQVKPDEEAYSDIPMRSEESATLYEHCVRAIERGMRLGKHGLPLMGCGDWNDGMNLVGEHGKGESVWLGFFLFEILSKFAKVATLHGDAPFAARCLNHAALLQKNLEANAWDGEWYVRAYFDNGDPLGSAANEECQIDSLPQSWAVLSGAGNPDRCKQAMAAAYRRLVDHGSRIVKLFDPPFDKSAQNPGYIKGYVPGVRENGGQYTHAAIWTAMAFAAQGDQRKAWELLEMINPLRHGSTAAEVAVYKVEPYVVSADVYAVAPHTGQGGWSWYTGSAGWLCRLILETFLGVHIEIDRLHFRPCVPPEWKEFKVRYRFRSTYYDLTVRPARDGPKAEGMESIVRAGESLLLIDDSEEHAIEVHY